MFFVSRYTLRLTWATSSQLQKQKICKIFLMIGNWATYAIILYKTGDATVFWQINQTFFTFALTKSNSCVTNFLIQSHFSICKRKTSMQNLVTLKEIINREQLLVMYLCFCFEFLFYNTWISNKGPFHGNVNLRGKK